MKDSPSIGKQTDTGRNSLQESEMDKESIQAEVKIQSSRVLVRHEGRSFPGSERHS